MKDLSFAPASIQRAQSLIYLLKCLFDDFTGFPLFSIPSPSPFSCVHLDRKEKWNRNEWRKSGVTNKEEHSKADKARGEGWLCANRFCIEVYNPEFLGCFFYHLGLPALL